jgi:hypothetical protein
MAARTFMDPSGRYWTVWDVFPGQHTTPHRVAGVHLPDDMAEGWLAFDGPDGKKRTYPIPAGWEGTTDAELWTLCEHAEPVVRRTPASGSSVAVE